MDSKLSKSPILHDAAFARRVFFRIFVFFSAISLIPILHILKSHDFKSLHPKSQPCLSAIPRGSYLFQGHFLNPVWDSFDPLHCQQNLNLTTSIALKLVDQMRLFNRSARALFVGGSSLSAASAMRDLGFPRAVGLDSGRLGSTGYGFGFPDGSFDFVLLRGSFEVSVPPLVVGEIERVLDRGGVGALAFGVFRAPVAAEVSSRLAGRVGKLLRASCVVDSGYVNEFYVIVFRKKMKQFDGVLVKC